MKKRVLSIIVLMLTVLMIGCSNNDTSIQNNDSKVNTGVTDISQMDFDEKYKYFSKIYPNSTILVWATDTSLSYEQELNNYLYQNDYNYIVCFKNIENEAVNDDGEYICSQSQAVYQMIKNNEKIDILGGISSVPGFEVISNLYYKFVDDGILEPLDDYLSNDKYSELLKLMPKKYWDSYKYNGHLYGIDNCFSSLYSDNGYTINNQVLSDCGFKPQDFQKPLNELETLLKTITEKTNKKFEIQAEYDTSAFYTANYIDIGLADIKENIVNMYEQPQTLEYFKLLHSLNEKGYLSLHTQKYNDISMELISQPAGYGNVLKNNTYGMTNVFYKQNNYIISPGNAAGVVSTSKNKEQAVDLLINMFFNKDFNNIITYGEEGKQYQISNGKVIMKDIEDLKNSDSHEYKYTPDTSFNNPIVSLHCDDYNDVIYPYDIYTAYETAEYLNDFGFYFDGTSVKDKYLKVMNIIYNINIENQDIDSYMKKLNKELYDAGMQDILDEANRQLAEFHKSHS